VVYKLQERPKKKMSVAEAYVERFSIKKLHAVEVQEHYRVEVAISCPIFEKLYGNADTAKFLLLQNPSQTNVGNVNKYMG
jgi:hypothetical protein